MDNENGRILSGRMFTPEDLELVKKITMEMFDTSRAEISREICRRLQWYKIDGGLKEMSGKNVLARLEKKGIVALPEPKRDYLGVFRFQPLPGRQCLEINGLVGHTNNEKLDCT